MTVSHHSTISSEIRAILDSNDLESLNRDFFLKATFVSELASYVQRKEAEAEKRAKLTPNEINRAV